MTENQEIIENDDIPIFACTNDQQKAGKKNDDVPIFACTNDQPQDQQQDDRLDFVSKKVHSTSPNNSNNNQDKKIDIEQSTPQHKNEQKTVPTNNQSKNSGSGIVYEFKNSNVTFGSSNQINEDNKTETKADSKTVTPVPNPLGQDNNKKLVITDDENRKNKQVDTDIGIFQCDNTSISSTSIIENDITNTIDGLFDGTKDVGVFDCGTVTPSTVNAQSKFFVCDKADNAQSKFFVCDNNSSNTNITNEMKTNKMKTNEMGIFECDGTSAEKGFRENGEKTEKLKNIGIKDIDVDFGDLKKGLNEANKNLGNTLSKVNKIIKKKHNK